jgi:hypothetical protein
MTGCFLAALALAGCTDDGGSAEGEDTTSDTTSDTTESTGDGDGDGDGDPTDDVVEIAIRRLNPDQDVPAFEAARDAFVDLLKMQPGVGTDREFMSVFDYSVFGPPSPPVYIGMTQYETLLDFQNAGAALGMSSEAGAFFSTFTPELFTVLVPLEPGGAVDLAGVANQPGQVLEVAVRDLSTYADFDPDAYAAARDAFLALLAQQPGFVAEYQWVSPIDANIAVGMTVYENADAFMAISQDPAFGSAPELAAFLGVYPPMLGHVNAVVK